MAEAEVPDTRWTELGVFEPLDLIDATAELHWATQLLASAAQTFAEAAEDDSHRAVVWAAELSAFVGAPFAAPYPLRVALRPSDLTLMILDRTGASVAVLPLPGESLDEAHEWIGLAAATYFGGAPPLLERPEYDLPVHPLQNGARFSTAILPELGALAALYGSAAEMIRTVVSERSDASGVLDDWSGTRACERGDLDLVLVRVALAIAGDDGVTSAGRRRLEHGRVDWRGAHG
jgi:hypothetical protein